MTSSPGHAVTRNPIHPHDLRHTAVKRPADAGPCLSGQDAGRLLGPLRRRPHSTGGPHGRRSAGRRGRACERDPQATSRRRANVVVRTVGLARCFSNPRKPLRRLIRRVLKGSMQPGSPPSRQSIEDVRGPVTRKSPGVQTRLNAQNRAALLDAYAAGESVNGLAERFKVHRATVRALARRAGLPRRNGSELPDSVREEAARLYASGLTLLDAGRQLGISNDAVRAAVVACGGTVRPKGRRPRVM